jgi:hypothetical protein
MCCAEVKLLDGQAAKSVGVFDQGIGVTVLAHLAEAHQPPR